MKQILIILMLLIPSILLSQYKISSSVFGPGETISGTGYTLSGSASQPHAAKLTGTGYKMNVGFWYRYYQQNIVDEVWVSENYCLSCPNSGHIWYYNAYDDLTPAMAFLEDGGTVHTDGLQTSSNLNLSEYYFTIANGDFSVTGDINGDGFIETQGNGSLVRTTNGTQTSFPVGFNGQKYEVIVEWSGGLSNEEVKVRVNNSRRSQLNSLSGNLWYIEGPSGMNATLKLFFPKSMFPNGFPENKFLLNGGGGSWVQHNYSVDSTDVNYYIVTITGVNEF